MKDDSMDMEDDSSNPQDVEEDCGTGSQSSHSFTDETNFYCDQIFTNKKELKMLLNGASVRNFFYYITEKSYTKLLKVKCVSRACGRDEYYMVAAENSLALNQDIQEEQVVPARYHQEFLTIAWEQAHLRIPLSRSEKCIVGTGLERQTTLDSGALAIAEREGRVVYTNTDTIVLAVQVKATSRELPVEIAAIEQRLAVVGDIITCLKKCNVQSDCSDGWLCSDCAPDALGDGRHCDKFLANGQGYFATKLQARYNNKQSV
ncbi:DNA-directed RNA polymerase subunit beta [Capsicum baccatum]|uniref:DNA-directed RNA polymerase n=1 Tax=Capsicum baccatum TaxID=33114 RepID=A0A2G2XEV3_CAPBA|nr:DNA-directed RNA polymerase subunit beta [Capsicum baccatum]